MRVAIIGTGLIGASVAKGLAASNYAEEILGFDRNPDVLSDAQSAKVVDRPLQIEKDAESIDLWVVATPPDFVADWVRKIYPLLSARSVVTDVASVKGMISSQLPEQYHRRFVGGHPMAGAATHGMQDSRADLFVDKHWILTPVGSDQDAIRRVEQMVHALDATPIQMSPQEHDEHVAMLSHLPNLLANVLSCLGANLPHAHVAGASWDDLTRVAGGNPNLWGQIMLHNREHILSAVRELKARLEAMEDALIGEDETAVRRYFMPHDHIDA